MSLQLSPVQLRDYVVISQAYCRHLPDEGEEPNNEVTITTNVRARRHEDEIQLLLSVHVNEAVWGDALEAGVDQERQAAFATRTHEGHVEVAGRFAWQGPESPPDVERLLIVNGLSFLYGIARVYLAQASAASPGPRLLLPSVSFMNMEVELDPDPEPSSEEGTPRTGDPTPSSPSEPPKKASSKGRPSARKKKGAND